MGSVAVWPLVPGLKGHDANGAEADLVPGRKGYMTEDDARDAQALDEVQSMVGESPHSLREPTYETAQVQPERSAKPSTKGRKKGEYSRRDMTDEIRG